ncbi:MAG: AAA family ATPase [Anaerolineaceae bacterium]|nr:AAA family ATPase [Anaerolineaceae bacterium]
MLEIYGYNPKLYGGMVLVDIVVANIWMAVLLIGIGKSEKIAPGRFQPVWPGTDRFVYQFHNTSDNARIRQKWDVNDNRFLRDDGANLAPFLLRLREMQPKYYARIVETIRQIAPFFADFVLEPIGNSVLLQWREKNTDIIFGPHQASDGTLRVMALVSLLLQPEQDLPLVVVLDEPELGLHPYAINILAGLLQSISTHTQIILATQSMTLIDYFEPNQIIVVDRPNRESLFRRLEEEPLKEWLEEYSLAELWEKNVLGGRPKG